MSLSYPQSILRRPTVRNRVAAFLLALVAMAFVGCYLAFLGSKDPARTDLAVYVAAAERLRAGEGLYFEQSNPKPIGEQYLYPPLLAQSFLAFPSLSAAWWGWSALSLAAFGTGLALIIRELNLLGRVTSLRWRMIGLVAMLSFPPLFYHLAWGQVQLVLFGLLTGVWFCLRRERNVLAGVLLSLCIMLKLYPAIWLIPLVAQRRWGTVLGATLGTLGLAVLSFSWAGWHELTILAQHVLPAVNRKLSAALYIDYYSMRATVSLLTSNVALAAGVDPLYRFAIGSVFVMVAARSSRRRDSLAAYSATAMLLVSPVIWSHYFVLLYLPILTSLADAKRPRPYAILALYLALALPPIIHTLDGVALAILHVLPTAGLLALFVWQTRQILASETERAQAPSRQRSASGRLAPAAVAADRIIEYHGPTNRHP